MTLAQVCGLFATLARLQPPGLRVVGKLALVRNSIGADAYVADEVPPTFWVLKVPPYRTQSGLTMPWFTVPPVIKPGTLLGPLSP